MDINEIIKQAEGRRLEFKEKLPGKVDLCKTIIAFANDAGGTLLIGIQDSPRIIKGLQENVLMSSEEQISNMIFDNCYPIISPEITIINVKNKFIIKVQIFRGSNLPYYLKSKGKNNGTYIRVGSSNRLANEEIIQEMERLKRNISYDSEPILDILYSKLSLEKFKDTYKETTGEICDNNSLKKLHLISSFQSEIKATNALLLLSNDALKTKIFPYAKIECARFKGTNSDVFIDQKTLDGNLLEQIEQAYTFVLRHINRGAIIEGVYTKSHWEYPINAIREAIRNAVIHRDYSLLGKDIKIAIYDDMIEITNPGKLLPSIEFDKMEARQSDIRNKVIAPVFKHLGFIDQWGNGLKLISDELKKYQDIEFKWFEKGLQFQVQFIKKYYKKSNEILISSPQVVPQVAPQGKPYVERLVSVMKGELSRGKIQERLGLLDRENFRKTYLLPSLKAEVIEMTQPNSPKSPTQKYRLTRKGVMLLNSMKNKKSSEN